MKKRSLLLCLLLVFALVLTSCGPKPGEEKPASNEQSTETAKEEPAEEEPVQEKVEEEPGRVDGELDLCIASEPNSIDPALNSAVDGAIILQHTFEGLIKWVDDGKGNATLVPGQAESWDVSEDGLTWTFHLRDGIKWHDGQPVTAHDFVYAWNRLCNPETTAEYEYMVDMVEGYEEKELNIKAVDDKTFEVKLHTLCPYFEEICAFPATFPVREDVVSNEAWATEAASYVGNGPYKLTEWQHNSKLVIEKDPEYYEADKIIAEKINFHLKDDTNGIYAGYRSGDLDFIEGVPTEEVPGLLKSGELKVRPYIGTYYLSFNNQKAPFDDPKVREAFSLAVDRNYIVEKITQTGQVPATGFVPSGVNDAKGPSGDDFRTVGGDYYSVDPAQYEANCERAKELLKEAGYPNGEGFPVVEYLYNTSEGHKAIGEALQNMWQEVLGVQVTLQNQEWKVFQHERKEGNYMIARDGWIADYNDPMSFLDMFLTGGGNNNPKYSNEKFDELIKAAKTSSDMEERMKLMHEAEDLAFGTEFCAAPLYFYTNSYMVKPNIEGIYYTPLGYFFFSNAKGF